MKFCDVNPFVRWALKMQISHSTDFVVCRDCRLFYILSGNAILYINGGSYKISNNSALLWPGGCIYKFEIEKPCKMVAINFDYTQSNSDTPSAIPTIRTTDFIDKDILENINFDDTVKLNNPIIISCTSEFKEKIKCFTEVFAKKEMYYSERCSALLKDIILDILQNSMFTSTDALGKVQNAIKFIQENYSENISNEDIAKVVNYHPYHLNKLMLKCTGLTLHKYLLNYRLEKAGEFILNKTSNISIIAEKCGFSSSYHLTNAFKQKYGCSPSKYQNKNANF